MSDELHERLSSVTSHMNLLSNSYQDIVQAMRDQNEKIREKHENWHDRRSDFELQFTQMSKKLSSYPDNEESQTLHDILSNLQQAVIDFDSEQESLEDMRREFDSLITQFLDRADDVIGAAKGDIPDDGNDAANVEDLQKEIESLKEHNTELEELVQHLESDLDRMRNQSRDRESDLTELLHEVQNENRVLVERNSQLESSKPSFTVSVSESQRPEVQEETETPADTSSGLSAPKKAKALYRNNTKTDWNDAELDNLKRDMMEEMTKMSRQQLAQQINDQDALRWREQQEDTGLSTPQSKSPRNVRKSVTMDIRLQVKDIFVLFDRNFDGVLEEDDLLRLLPLFKTTHSVEELMDVFGPRCEFIKFLRKMQDFREEAVIILQSLTTYLNNKIRDIFFIFDKDQSGSLQRRDLEEIFNGANVNIDELFEPPCSFQEFLFGFKNWYKTDSANPHPLLNIVEQQTEIRMEKVFEFFDDHKDGLLTLQNCQEILGIVGEDKSRAQAVFHPPTPFKKFFKAWGMVERPVAASILQSLESHIKSVSWDEKTGRPPKSLFRSGTVTNWTPDQLELLKNEMKEEHAAMAKANLADMVSKQENLRWMQDDQDSEDKHSLAKDIRLQVLSVFVFFDSDMDAELQMEDLKRMLEAVENKRLSEEDVRQHFQPPCDFIKFLKKIQQLRSQALVILQKLQNFIENKVRDVFFIFDEDNDGILQYGDVEKIFALSSSECDVENLFEPPCDVNAFIAGFRQWLRQDDVDPHPVLKEVKNRIESRLKAVFHFFDSSNSGQLSEDDCREILLAVGEDPVRVNAIFRPPVSFPVFVQAWRTIARPLAASILVALENYIDKKSQYHIPEDAEVDKPTTSTNLAIPRRLFRANTKTEWNPEELESLKDEMRKQMKTMAKSEVARMLDEQEKLRWGAGGSSSAPTTPRPPDDKTDDDQPKFGPASSRMSVEDEKSAGLDLDDQNVDNTTDKTTRAFRHGTNTSWSSQDLETLKNEMMAEMQDINKQEVKRLMDSQDKLRWAGNKDTKKIRFDPNLDVQVVPPPERRRKELPAIPSQHDIDFQAEIPDDDDEKIQEATKNVVKRLVRSNTKTVWGEDELAALQKEMKTEMANLHKQQLAKVFQAQDELRWQNSSMNSNANSRSASITREESFETESVVNEQMQVLGDNPAYLEYKKEHDKEMTKLNETIESLERQLANQNRRKESQGDSKLSELRRQLEHEKEQALKDTQAKQKEMLLQAQLKFDEEMSEMKERFEAELEDLRQAKMRSIENSAVQMEKMRQMIMQLSQMVKT